MSDNLPKELRVNPVSIDDVKTLIKEATKWEILHLEIDDYGISVKGYTDAEIKDILLKIAQKKLIVYRDGISPVDSIYAYGLDVIVGSLPIEEETYYAYSIYYGYGDETESFMPMTHLFLTKGDDELWHINIQEY